jgi:hypothetical protein
MKVIKKLTKYLLAIILVNVLILIFSFPIWIKAIPNKYISLLAGKVAVVDNLVCTFSTQIKGESMNPLIAPGGSLELNRCFKEEDLTEGTIIFFEDGPSLRFGIIRHILPLDQVVYKVSDEKAPELLYDVIKEEITAINKSVDVAKSKYQAEQKTESLILDSSEFLTDFYLAKIPKGTGIETATVERTASFFREKDKFCFVIAPKKNLIGVELEISNTKTGEKVSLGKDIIFTAGSKPNINCLDFGSSQGMLNLDPGTYQYRFLMNHQALADIQFEVR